MAGRNRSTAALCASLLAAVAALAGCGRSGGVSTGDAHNTQSAAHPRAVAAPSGLIAGTAPQPNGTLWVLSRSGRVRTIRTINLATGRMGAPTGVSSAARGLAQSSTGSVAVGLGSARSGAVELHSASGALTATIPVGAPVMSLAYGQDGTTLYVLDGTAKTRSVTVIDTSTRRATRTIGLPSDARSIVPTPDQKAIWSLQASGAVQETSLTTGKPIESFPTGSPGIAVATSPSGAVLYVLKGTRNVANIAVVTAATEQIRRVLPAAANSVDLGVSPDGSQVYDFVGAASYGNVQILSS